MTHLVDERFIYDCSKMDAARILVCLGLLYLVTIHTYMIIKHFLLFYIMWI